MASFLLQPFLFLFFFTSLISFSSPLKQQQQQELFLPLSHSLANSHNTTLHHLLKLSSHRSISRVHRHRRARQVSLPLTSGSDYTLSLSLPPRPAVPLYMDTGSDLVWLPCAPFECILCENKPKPTTPPVSLPPSSRPVPCHSHLCSAAHSSLPSSDLCAIASCPLDSIETSSCSSSPCPRFYYAYGDGSLIASLHHAHVSLSSPPPQLHLRLRPLHPRRACRCRRLWPRPFVSPRSTRHSSPFFSLSLLLLLRLSLFPTRSPPPPQPSHPRPFFFSRLLLSLLLLFFRLRTFTLQPQEPLPLLRRLGFHLHRPLQYQITIRFNIH